LIVETSSGSVEVVLAGHDNFGVCIVTRREGLKEELDAMADADEAAEAEELAGETSEDAKTSHPSLHECISRGMHGDPEHAAVEVNDVVRVQSQPKDNSILRQQVDMDDIDMGATRRTLRTSKFYSLCEDANENSATYVKQVVESLLAKYRKIQPATEGDVKKAEQGLKLVTP
jgi:antitoxin component of MazEF toxin-antitoxin module